MTERDDLDDLLDIEEMKDCPHPQERIIANRYCSACGYEKSDDDAI